MEMMSLEARVSRLEASLGLRSDEPHSGTIMQEIDKLCCLLGFGKSRGTEYIKTGLLLCYVNAEYALHGNLTKTLYPLLADIYRVRPNAIEHDMRFCIERAFQNHSRFFVDVLDYAGTDRPSIGLFLTYAGIYLKGV